MDKTKTISTIIKTSIGIIFAIFFVVLISQYISMAQLNAKKDRLDLELSAITQQYENLSNEYDNISENFEDYVEDYVRDNYDYGYDGETQFDS